MYGMTGSRCSRLMLGSVAVLSGFVICAALAPPPGPRSTVAALFQIQGSGVTPFSVNNQNLIINAFTASMTTVSRADIVVRYFTSDTDRVPTFTNATRRLLLSEVNPCDNVGIQWHSTFRLEPIRSHRRLLDSITKLQPQTVYQNTVYLVLYINAGTPSRISTVQTDLRAALTPSGIYNAVPVQVNLQSYGQSGWSIQLMNEGSVDPLQPLAVETACKEKFSDFCLDGSGLSSGGVKGIIAAGCILLVLVPAILCVLIDLRRRSGKMAGTPHSFPDTPRTPMQNATNSITTYLRTSLNAVKNSALSSTGRHQRPVVEDTLPRPVPAGNGAATANVQLVNSSAAKPKSSGQIVSDKGEMQSNVLTNSELPPLNAQGNMPPSSIRETGIAPAQETRSDLRQA